MKMNVLKSLQALAVTRPPLLLFILSLFALVATILSMVFYIHLNNEMPNMLMNENWDSFLNELKKAKFCLIMQENLPGSYIKSLPNNTESHQSIVFSVKTNFSSSFQHNLAHYKAYHTLTFYGNLQLPGWRPSCEISSSTSNHSLLFMKLVLPVSTSNADMSCFTIYGHQSMFTFEEISTQSQLCPIANESTMTGGKVIAVDHSQLVGNLSCKPEDLFQFTLDHDLPAPKRFLSVDRRVAIASHLLNAAYLLLALIFLLLMIGALQGRNVLYVKHHLLLNEEPLQS